jgi:hypothetical protein
MVGLTLYTWAGCVAFIAWAEDETVTLDADVDSLIDTYVNDSGCVIDCDEPTEHCYLHLIEDPETGDDDALIATDSNQDQLAVFDFEALGGIPSTATDAQHMNFKVSECDDTCTELVGTGQPNGSVDVYCNDVHQLLIWNGPIPGGTQVDYLFSFDWTFPSSGCAADGSDAQIGLKMANHGKQAGERWICYESVEWEVTWAVGRDRRAIVMEGMHR